MSRYNTRYMQPASHKLKVGDHVTVYVARWHDGYTPSGAVVTKAGPIWLTLEEVRADNISRPRTWRMRRDTQNINSKYSQQDHFRTAEQIEWHAAQDAAQAVLKAHGVEVRRDGRWDSDEGVLRLAALLEADNPSLPVREPGTALALIMAEHSVLLDHHANHAFS